MKKANNFILILIFLSGFIVSPFFQVLNKEPRNSTEYENEGLKISDIAGTDLYAEQINALVAGNKSIIKQSLFTNDTSILPHFDTRDPAFYKCNVLLSASNGIVPEIFPGIVSENEINNQFGLSFNGFSGFLYYDENLSVSEVQQRADRALEIIKRKFELDLILLNVSDSYFFPFVGYYPNWEIYLHELIDNVPLDGYWKAFDIQRLISDEYVQNFHLSSTFLLVSSLDLLEKDFLELIDQINFNLDSLDLSYLDTLEVENLFEQFINISVNLETIFGNFSQFFESNQTSSQEEFGNFSGVFDALALSNESHYTSLMIQYEGLGEGITKMGQSEYSFNLWEALGYKGGSLRPSEKIFIALIGAFMSEININILCTEIIDETPRYFELYDFLLEQVGLLLFYAGVDFDIQTLQDYSFELFWRDEGGIKQSWVNIINLNDDLDFINFLSLIGIEGLSGVPTGIFNPVDDFVITYRVSYSEPNIVITKELLGDNASFGVYNDFAFNITAENVGNETTWGVPTSIPLSLEDIFSIIPGNLGVDLMNAIWEVARVEYPGQYVSLDDFFNFDKDPRIFYFDTTGIGLIDTYYPDLTNIANLLPYNEKMDNVIDNLNPQLIEDLGSPPFWITPDILKDLFTNNESIWNDENWYLEPGETFSYEYSNFSIENFDSFSPFYEFNFTIKETFPELPAVISGISVENTDPTMALENDTESWIIQSEEKYVDVEEIEVQFLFKNETYIDLVNNSLDSVSIIINISDPSNNIDFEIFNYSIGEFEDITPFLTSSENDTYTYSFIRNNGSLDWLFDPLSRDNHSIVFKIRGIDSDVFNISINDLDVQFSYRDINEYLVLGSRILYASSSGNVHYVKRSNTVSLSTLNMASIIAVAQITNYSSEAGEINTYTLMLKNIGSDDATNINITILIPGILSDRNNFTLENNYLSYYLSGLAPLEEKTINFSFYIPNSGMISSTKIKYNNINFIQNLNSTELTTFSNDVYFSAPIDYDLRFPFVKIVEFFYNSSNLTPTIGEIFNITLNAKNVGTSEFELTGVNISLSDQYGHLEKLGINKITFTNISYNEIKSVNITLKKLEWKGYYYPPINFIENDESRMIQVARSNSIVLGSINLSIIKTVDKNQLEIGDIIVVHISIENTGSICIKDISISDIVSFTQIEFTLIEGSLIQEIEPLTPGQIFNFSYKIQAMSQAIVNLNPASIDYYFLYKSKEYSNAVEVKIIIPKSTQILLVIVPSIISLIIISVFLRQVKKLKVKKYNLQRNELFLFRASARDMILKKDNLLREKLNILSKNEGEGKTSGTGIHNLRETESSDHRGDLN